jgi:2'-5' RNA ligase
VADAPDPVQPETQRLFFALWPDDATRDALDHTGKWLHRYWGGRRMRAETLHLTLAFLGATRTAELPALRAVLDGLDVPAFSLRLDQVGFWPGNRIAWLTPGAPPAGLATLAGELRAGLQAAGVSFDPRPFFPHVTLLRNSSGGMASACQPVHWHVDRVALLESGSAGGRSGYVVCCEHGLPLA